MTIKIRAVLAFLLLMVVSMEVEAIEWEIGGAIHGYNQAGTVDLTKNFLEGEVRGGIRYNDGVILRISFGSTTITHSGDELLRVNTLRLDRTADISPLGLDMRISTGLGVNETLNVQSTEIEYSNALNYTVSLEQKIYKWEGLVLRGGILFTGSPVPSTETFSDRVGVSISVSSSVGN
ncbi:hypothetical protein ACFLQV_00115 [Calditrichota bacterium]